MAEIVEKQEEGRREEMGNVDISYEGKLHSQEIEQEGNTKEHNL